MIRANFMREIDLTLASNRLFVRADFDVTQADGKEGGGTQLRVTYRYVPGYFFAANIPRHPHEVTVGNTVKRNTYEISTVAAPGGMSDHEQITVVGGPELLSALKNWLSNLASDLKALPQMRAQDALRRDVDEWVASVSAELREIENGDAYFSVEEAEGLKDRLSEFEQRMEQIAAKAIQDRAALEERVATIHKDFEALRSQTAILTRASWFKSALVRIAQWLSDPESKKLLQSGTEVAKILLGDGKSSGT
jgi:hypothetical protein